MSPRPRQSSRRSLPPRRYGPLRCPRCFPPVGPPPRRRRSSASAGAAWRSTAGRRSRPDDCPGHLRLFLLANRDLRDLARIVSCHQEIAADGVVSLGMIAEFGATIGERGAWWYRHLYWEAGILGQVLYLEAEATGVRG